MVKVQLVSGNAEFNLLTNDEIYIDELKLGGPYVPPMPEMFQFFLPESEMKAVYGSVDEVDGGFLACVLPRSERRKSGQCSCV